MHETGFDASLPISAFFKTGKMDTDFEISDKYITGICVMYAQRSAQEHEYMIREKSIVTLDERGLSQCVQDAKDLAYRAAVSRLGNVSFLSTVEPPEQKAVTLPSLSPTPALVTKKPAPPPVIEYVPDDPGDDDENGNEWDPSEDGAYPSSDANPPDEDGDAEEPMGGAQPFDLNGLRPASSLIPETKASPQSSFKEEDPSESAYEKARNMPITILGKLHECNNWTAGRILDEKPQIIVDFAHRYNGPKVEERDALKMLYSDALRKVNQAA